jgi:hypothetical protein
VVSSSPAPSILVAHRQTHRLLAILLVLLPVIVAATVITVPFSTPMGGVMLSSLPGSAIFLPSLPRAGIPRCSASLSAAEVRPEL